MASVRELLTVAKRVRLPEKVVTKAHPSHRAWDLALIADIPGMFAVYFRVNVRLPEAFSVGLRYQPEHGQASVLVRVNGDHGQHANPDGLTFDGAHVHMPIDDQLLADLPATPWSQGPPFALPLGLSYLRVYDAWEMLATSTNIENTPAVQAAILKAEKKISDRQLTLT